MSTRARDDNPLIRRAKIAKAALIRRAAATLKGRA
jgi:hypothetical protein